MLYNTLKYVTLQYIKVQCNKVGMQRLCSVRQSDRERDKETDSQTHSGSLGMNAGSFFGISVISTSVVRTRAAIEAAFSMALIVTCNVCGVVVCVGVVLERW